MHDVISVAIGVTVDGIKLLPVTLDDSIRCN